MRFNGRKVKPFYLPPGLFLKQALSFAYFTLVTRWTGFPCWLRELRKVLPTSAGATGMGCIGFSIHPVWEITSACNLRCKQCHASSGKADPFELTTEEGKSLLDEMAKIPEFRMLALGGGEPLVRRDILELVEHARQLGFEISIATNGNLLTREKAREFKKLGVTNMAIGLNSVEKSIHEGITQVEGSFERSLEAIHITRELGMNLHINATVMNGNRESIPDLLDFASRVKAQIVLLYHLMPEGRGREEMGLKMMEYKEIAQLIRQKQKRSSAVIEPVCSPQYWAYLVSNSPLLGRSASFFFKGCVAGSGLCYIKPNGDVWACPFIPVSAGNVKETPLSQIWYSSDLFSSLRDKSNLKGRCGVCGYKNTCGGCRGRAYAQYGDYLEEDPTCFLRSEEELA